MNTSTLIILRYFGLLNFAVFTLTLLDKRRALKNKRRIPELWLYGPVTIGAFPGLLLGMILARHKTAKLTFQLKTAAALVLFVLLVYVIWRFTA